MNTTFSTRYKMHREENNVFIIYFFLFYHFKNRKYYINITENICGREYHGKVTEFRDENGKSPKNRLIYILVHMSILQIAIKD